MVSVVTALGRNGLQDWLLQRFSAIVMALYTLLVVAIWVYIPDGDMQLWKQIFSTLTMRFITFVALVALLVHVWIGMWTITTDYMKNMWVRLLAQLIIYTALFIYLAWGIQILW